MWIVDAVNNIATRFVLTANTVATRLVLIVDAFMYDGNQGGFH